MKPRRFLWLALLASGCVSFGLAMPENLKDHGVTAEATILDIWDTGWTVNGNPAIGMHVEVKPESGAPFRATIQRCVVSRIAVPRPGDVIAVRYDPADPSVVVVDVRR